MQLEDFNATARQVPDATLPELFEAQVARRGDATALTFREASLTYGELNARANRLAHHLIGLGVGPESLVGIALERSLEMVVALLATLKAGGAYLPLDPEYPQARLGHMLADAAPAVVLSTRGLHGRLGVTALALDAPEARAALGQAPAHDPTDEDRRGPLRPAQPAYVIYTSGSTGTPKGVVVTHAGIPSLAGTQADLLAVTPGSRILQFASLSFDGSLWEVVMALTAGATLILLREGARSGPALAEVLVAQRVTHAALPPVVLATLEEEDGPALEVLIVAGEVCPGDLVRRWSRGRRMVNSYGPTETTVCATMSAPLEGGGPRPPGGIEGGGLQAPPLGSPIWNTRVYVLDARLEPVGAGVTGELYVAGAGLARGYLGRPALTAERFVADPYGPAGRRMYRSGDLAHWRADGMLEFHGRADHQVKLRGFRVEPGEIEAALVARDTVAQAVVVARDDGPGGGMRLVACLVAAAGAVPEAATLRRALGERLPEYMVPSAFVVLDALPLTPNGKIDRKALLESELPVEGGSYRQPRTPEEQILCELFAEVLAIRRVGIDDDFFALGGHSLVATRLISRVRAALGVELAVRTVFEAPTVAQLAGRLGEVRVNETALAARPRPERLPLSHAQSRLWFLHRLEGPSATYNNLAAQRLEGELDTAALKTALADVVARHESLRTLFPEDDGGPFQRILPAAEARPALVVETVAEAALAEHLAEAAATALDLDREIPLRAWLFPLEGEARRHVLLLLLHHIAGDGWSLNPLWRDLARAYAARRHGESPVFAELPVQYADYTLWQRDLLGEESDPDSVPLGGSRGENRSLVSRQLGFWRTALAGAPEELTLPADHPRPAVASHRGSTVPVRLEAPLHRRLLELARASGASLFMVLQAALAALLSRLGAGEDIPIGSPIAGRGEPALEGLVGFFVNTLVLRTDVSGDPSFRELIARVRAFDLEAYGQAELPFEQLVEALQPTRSLARHPLFQVMLVLVLHNAPGVAFALPGLTVRREPIPGVVAKFDLTLALGERLGSDGEPAGIEGDLEYGFDLFERATAEALAERFVRLVEAAVEAPGEPLRRLGILTPGQRQTLLESFNATSRRVGDATLPELFEAQVSRTPEAIALTFGETSLAYVELNARANRLAHHLIGLGIGPERLVGIALERSLEMVVTLLATLKAGAAYVPLDPRYPRARLARMIADGPLILVLSAGPSSRRLPRTAGVPILSLDAAETLAALARTPAHDPKDAERSCPLRPQHPAHVIYTSGSTGSPKGVVGTTRGVVNRLRWGWGEHPFAASEICCFKTSFNFVDHVAEVFSPLLRGVPLVVFSDAVARDPARLLDELTAKRVTRIVLVPALLREILQRAPGGIEGHLGCLERWFSSGETLSAALAREFFETFPQSCLYNVYGSTEVAADATCHALPRRAPSVRDEFELSKVPIGEPIWNLRTYVLDAGLEPVPVGVTGELYVAGVGLARGYLGRPGLAAEHFVADPFGIGARIYRTGDLARWRADGKLELHGRADQQVKIRGFRVEPGEIEAALAAHPGVRSCVVVMHEAYASRLVAYVAAGSSVPTLRSLRQHLAARLPAYMIPAAFVWLEALPLLPTGKVNRQALPAPEGLRPELECAYVPPRAPAEELLSGIWCQVLGLKKVGIHDNFFDIGGDSILSARTVYLARQVGLKLSTGQVFEHQSIADLAAVAVAAERPVEAVDTDEEAGEAFPLSSMQERFWARYRAEAATVPSTVPTLFRLSGPLRVEIFERSLEAVVERHEVLRTTFGEYAGEPAQRISPPRRTELPVVDLEALSPGEQEAVALRFAAFLGQAPIDLEQGPVFRTVLFRGSAREHTFLFLTHHIAFDGWSHGVFVRELQALYRSFSTGQPPRLPALPIQYRHFARWQQRYCQGEEHASYWREQLRGVAGSLPFNPSAAQPVTPRFRAATEVLTLSEDLSQRLRELSRRRGKTLFTVLLAAFKALLHLTTRQDDIAVSSFFFNRERAEFEDLIGIFAASLPLRSRLISSETFSQLLERVHGTVLEAQTHSHVLVEKILADQGTAPGGEAGQPFFRVMFRQLNPGTNGAGLSRLKLDFIPVDTGRIKHDLTVTFGDDGARLGARWKFSADIFDTAARGAMIAQYRVLIERVVEDPDLQIGELLADDP